MTTTCPSGLTGYPTRRKAMHAAAKRRLQSGGMDRTVVPIEPCKRCGWWHCIRRE